MAMIVVTLGKIAAYIKVSGRLRNACVLVTIAYSSALKVLYGGTGSAPKS